MPFSEQWSDDVYEYVREITQQFGIRAERADTSHGHIIVQDIWRLLNEALFVVADVTVPNANVYYELGIAHTLGKETILLAHSTANIPFDINFFRHLLYGGGSGTARVLREKLPAFIEAAIRNARQDLAAGTITGGSRFALVEERLRAWQRSGYNYDETLDLNILHALKGAAELDSFTPEMLAFCLISATYRRPWDRPSEALPFWIRRNQFNIAAGEALGMCIGMPARRVRYLAAFILQFMSSESRNAGLARGGQDPDNATLLDRVREEKVETYVGQTNTFSDLDPTKRSELLQDFTFIRSCLNLPL